jgi:hypothetical protein
VSPQTVPPDQFRGPANQTHVATEQFPPVIVGFRPTVSAEGFLFPMALLRRAHFFFLRNNVACDLFPDIGGRSDAAFSSANASPACKGK